MMALPLEITQPILQRGFIDTNNAGQPSWSEEWLVRKRGGTRQSPDLLLLPYHGPLASDRAIPGDVKERVARNMGRRKDTAPVAERAQRWIAEHPQVYALFVRFAMQVAARRKRFSAKAIVERLRWETTVQGGKEFKIPNAVTAYLARQFVSDHPEHAGLFLIAKRGAAQ